MAGLAAVRTNHARRAVRDGARSEAVARRTRPEPIRPTLVVVPRRRRTARIAAGAFGVLFVLMLGVVVFQTRLAETQLDLDRIEQRLDLQRERARDLRRENAALRSPDRIAAQAQALGLVATEAHDFLVVPSDVVDLVDVSSGDALDDVFTRESDAFRDYRETKQLVSGEGP
ncbi:MAG: hypothetical protein R2705_04120 [Ilumatobacteraceae bacterium]